VVEPLPVLQSVPPQRVHGQSFKAGGRRGRLGVRRLAAPRPPIVPTLRRRTCLYADIAPLARSVTPGGRLVEPDAPETAPCRSYL